MCWSSMSKQHMDSGLFCQVIISIFTPSFTLFKGCPVDAAEVDPLDGGLGGEALAEALGRLADVMRVALEIKNYIQTFTIPINLTF